MNRLQEGGLPSRQRAKIWTLFSVAGLLGQLMAKYSEGCSKRPEAGRTAGNTVPTSEILTKNGIL